MANTPRETVARIVLGVDWTAEKGSIVFGLDQQLDDQKFQSAFGTDRVQPLPRFVYKPLTYQSKHVGVLEISVDISGPFTPVKDFDGLQAGAIYFRRGTTCERAVGDEIRRVVNWFQGGVDPGAGSTPCDRWTPFLDSVHKFSRGTSYLLVTDHIDQGLAGISHSLGLVPWRAVLDFDVNSDTSGLLGNISGTLSKRRTIHRVVRGEHLVHPEPGIHWFFARGMTGIKESAVINNDHRTWLKAYKQEIAKQLLALAGAISPSPVVVVVLWEDVLLKNHLRTMLEELNAAFGDFLEIVLISQDRASFENICEEAGGRFIEMSRRSLLSGLAVHFADANSVDSERFIVNTPNGSAVEITAEDWLWLSEDMELLHRGAGRDGTDDPDAFRRGADVTWRDLQLHHDCDRDVSPLLRSQVDEDLKHRRAVRINLYHSPGAGGTTVGRRIAWDAHNLLPVCRLTRCLGRETADKIAKIAALCESTVLVLIDGAQLSERDIDDLFDYLKAAQTSVVLLQVLRRSKNGNSDHGRRQFWLDSTLSDTEADRFRVEYSKAAPYKRAEINTLALRNNSRDRTAFYFGLTAFEKDFKGLRPYVQSRLEDLGAQQKSILVFIALAHYYGQQPIPAQTFASLLGIPHVKPVEIRNVFIGDANHTLDLLVEASAGMWRTSHPLIALELLKILLAPSGAAAEGETWRQSVSKWAKEFATLCGCEGSVPSDSLLELARRVFIYRDNVEVMGTERATNHFSHLLDDIPSDVGRIDVLRHLTECFPEEAHMHAHLGRFLGTRGEFAEALHEIGFAISLQNDDHVLHHMRGMVYRQKLKAIAEKGASLDELVEVCKEASDSFARARSMAPDLEHGYISEIQTLLELVDRARMSGVVNPVGNQFLKEALERAEDLLDQLQHLYAGEEPSRYALDCQARMSRLYGDFQVALQNWDNLLARPEVPKPPVRRQIVWTLLRRHQGQWENMSRKEAQRAQRLLEENLQENSNDSTSLRLWLRAIRYSVTPPSLDALTEKVSYWRSNTTSLDAAFYLYVMHFLRALKGSAQALVDFEQALEVCKSITKYRRDRTRSFEWIGPKDGIGSLVHQSQLGDWMGDFWESTSSLTRLEGRIKSIDGPQKGTLELESGAHAFFVPAKSDIHEGRDEHARITCFIGLSYDGPRAWDVKLSGASL